MEDAGESRSSEVRCDDRIEQRPRRIHPQRERAFTGQACIRSAEFLAGSRKKAREPLFLRNTRHSFDRKDRFTRRQLVWLAFINFVAFLLVFMVIAVTWATFRVAGLDA
jgi:hypothetical protein